MPASQSKHNKYCTNKTITISAQTCRHDDNDNLTSGKLQMMWRTVKVIVVDPFAVDFKSYTVLPKALSVLATLLLRCLSIRNKYPTPLQCGWNKSVWMVSRTVFLVTYLWRALLVDNPPERSESGSIAAWERWFFFYR